MKKYELNEGDKVIISKEGVTLTAKVILDNKITGNIPYLPTFDKELDVFGIFNEGYRYAKVKIEKV